MSRTIRRVFSSPSPCREYRMCGTRFKNDAERGKHREATSKKAHLRYFLKAFGIDTSTPEIFCTLTFSDTWLPLSDESVKRIRKNFVRSLQRKHPGAVIYTQIDRADGSDRPCLRMVSSGIPMKSIFDAWRYCPDFGKRVRILTNPARDRIMLASFLANR